MAGLPDSLPPSARRRSVLAGVGAATGIAALDSVDVIASSDNQDDADTQNSQETPMNLVTDLEQPDSFPSKMTAVSVAQMNTRKKFEYRQDIPGIILDRMLYSEVRYPGDYGFVPQTAMGDGDPLDVLIMLESSLFPGCILDVRPVAVIRMTDAGENDDKIIGVPADDPRFAHIEGKDDLPPHQRDEVAEFFRTYKNLEPDGNIEVTGFEDETDAKSLLLDAHDRFLDSHEDACDCD